MLSGFEHYTITRTPSQRNNIQLERALRSRRFLFLDIYKYLTQAIVLDKCMRTVCNLILCVIIVLEELGTT